MSTTLTVLRYTTGAIVGACVISLLVAVGFAFYGLSLPKKISTNDKATLNKVTTFKNNQYIVNWVFGGTAILSAILMYVLYYMTMNENKSA
jgi:hypothetical protein